MIYVISDIHGCYDEYMELLEKIHFSDSDELYVLGDVADRGPEPVKVLQDMMLRSNVYPILGNHDYMALTMLEKMNVEITAENVESHFTTADMLSYMHWIHDGGETTARAFAGLDASEKEAVLDYLKEFSLYERVSAGGRHFVLVHGGIHNFDPARPLDDYHFSDFIFYRADYHKRYFDENTYLVTGHTPTFKINRAYDGLVYEANGHIALDCGCVYWKQLAAYCLNTGQITYVKKK